MVSGIRSIRKSNQFSVAVYGSQNGKSKRIELSGTAKQLNKTLALACVHPPKDRFVRVATNPYPSIVLGDHDTNIAKVELDENYGFADAKRIAFILNERHGLDGFMILCSSSTLKKIERADYSGVAYRYRQKNWHLVFNRQVTFRELCSILAWLSLYLKDQNFDKWLKLQLIKGTFTLRHGFKKGKNPPKIVFRYGHQDKMIKQFLANRKFILKFLRERSHAKKE